MSTSTSDPYLCPGCARPLAATPPASTSRADQPWLLPSYWCRRCGGTAELHLARKLDPGDHVDADRPPGTSGSWGEA